MKGLFLKQFSIFEKRVSLRPFQLYIIFLLYYVVRTVEKTMPGRYASKKICFHFRGCINGFFCVDFSTHIIVAI